MISVQSGCGRIPCCGMLYRGYPLFLSTFAPMFKVSHRGPVKLAFGTGVMMSYLPPAGEKKLQKSSPPQLDTFIPVPPLRSSFFCLSCPLVSDRLIIDMDTSTIQPPRKRREEENKEKITIHWDYLFKPFYLYFNSFNIHKIRHRCPSIGFLFHYSTRWRRIKSRPFTVHRQIHCLCLVGPRSSEGWYRRHERTPSTDSNNEFMWKHARSNVPVPLHR